MEHQARRCLFCCAMLLIWRIALTQQLPFEIAIDYQRADSLTVGQRALLESVVTAAYRTLQSYVKAKSPASNPLLCERVCRSYRRLPPPPLAPNDNDNSNNSSSSSSSSGSVIRRCYPDNGADTSSSSSPFAPSSSSSSPWEPRLQMCGFGTIRPAHVRWGTATAYGSSSSSNNTSSTTAGSSKGGEGTGTAVAVHLYLYVTADPSPADCAIAAAGGSGKGMQSYTCLYDSATGRPTMSALNVCPQALDLYDVDSLVARALRELIRAMGVERVGFFGLAPRESYLSYIVLDSDPGGMLTRFLATPRVKQVVRQFFGCDTAPGALLEDAYSTDAALFDSSVVVSEGEELDEQDYIARLAMAFAGWETTHFQGDVLIADPDPMPAAGTAAQVTPLTLALLYDTTWYDVVPASEAGYWSWGRGAGCGFATRHCDTLLDNSSSSGSNAGSSSSNSSDYRSSADSGDDGSSADGGSDGSSSPDGGGGDLSELTGALGEVLLCDPANYGMSTLACIAGGASVGVCRSRPLTTGARCGLLTSVTPRLTTCTARELEITALSGGDAAAAATFGWSSGAASSCLPLTWPWVAAATPPTNLVIGDIYTSTSDVIATYPAAQASTPSAGASCFRTSCSAARELWVHVLGTAIRCQPGAVLNMTNVTGGRLQRAILGPCPDSTSVCGGGGSGCDVTTCSSRGGECRPLAAAAASAVASADGAMRCYCRPGYGGTACQQYLGTAAGAGGVVGAAEEDLAGLAAAEAVQEASVVLRMSLPVFLLAQDRFLQAIAAVGDEPQQQAAFDGISGSGGNIPLEQLTVARVYGMSYLPAIGGAAAAAVGDSQAEPRVQVVFRFLAASSVQQTAFRTLISLGAASLAPRLGDRGFPVAEQLGGISYLGEAQLRAPGPPPPPPPPPPSPAPLPLPAPPAAASSGSGGSSSGGGGSSGLSGDDKVALGVGVTFGTLLLLLCLWVGCSLKRRAAKTAAEAEAAKAKHHTPPHQVACQHFPRGLQLSARPSGALPAQPELPSPGPLPQLLPPLQPSSHATVNATAIIVNSAATGGGGSAATGGAGGGGSNLQIHAPSASTSSAAAATAAASSSSSHLLSPPRPWGRGAGSGGGSGAPPAASFPSWESDLGTGGTAADRGGGGGGGPPPSPGDGAQGSEILPQRLMGASGSPPLPQVMLQLAKCDDDDGGGGGPGGRGGGGRRAVAVTTAPEVVAAAAWSAAAPPAVVAGGSKPSAGSGGGGSGRPTADAASFGPASPFASPGLASLDENDKC